MDPNRKRHAFGQHFLRDASIAGKIAESAVDGAVSNGCRALLEIGPGHGAITVPILEHLGRLAGKESPIQELILCEKDRDLVGRWKRELDAREGFDTRVEEADFLDLDETKWVGSSRVDLQACKLEYSIVSPK